MDMKWRCVVARTKNEKITAHNLTVGEYARSGYISLEKSGKYPALPSDSHFYSSQAITLILKKGKKISGTVTIIPDSAKGMPLDKIFKKEADILRKKKIKLAEIIQLAVDRSSEEGKTKKISRMFFKLIPIFKKILQIGEKEKIDGFCITVQKKHSHFYDKISFVSNSPYRKMKSTNKTLQKIPVVFKILYRKQVDKNMVKNGFFGKI